MSPPPVSVLIPTYGRVSLLEEAIYSFLVQDYPGEAELVVMNDVSEQELSWGGPTPPGRTVRIISLPTKVTTGAKRNALVAAATHDVVQFWDDDDIYLPHKISLGHLLRVHSVAGQVLLHPAVQEANEWRMDAGGTSLLLHQSRPSAGIATLTKSAIADAGGFPDLVQLSDVKLMGTLSRLRLLPRPAPMEVPPATIYRRYVGEGISHISTCKSAEGGRLSDAEADSMMGLNLAERLASGQEPSGKITLLPHWDSDYSAMALAAWAEQAVAQ